MANWNEIKQKITKTTNKIAKKTGEAADTAAKHIRLKGIEGKLSDKYESLGRTYYKQLKGTDVEIEKIEELLVAIDTLVDERKTLKAEIEADKQRRKEEKKARQEEKEAEQAEQAEADTEEKAE